MKTVIDAVNDLNASSKMLLGKIDDDSIWTNAEETIYARADKKGYQHSYKSQLPDSCLMVCTVDDFNACVDELSAATWIDGISIEEWKAGMKNTVIDSHGNELELSKIYEFSDHGIEWKASILLGLVDDEVEYLSSDSGWSMFIRECQSPLGTIKKAPVKLVDGKAYQFESLATGKIWVGFYNSTNDRFNESVGGDGSNCFIGDVSDFKNIIPLVPEVE